MKLTFWAADYKPSEKKQFEALGCVTRQGGVRWYGLKVRKYLTIHLNLHLNPNPNFDPNNPHPNRAYTCFYILRNEPFLKLLGMCACISKARTKGWS